jgi:hypothetical protein
VALASQSTSRVGRATQPLCRRDVHWNWPLCKDPVWAVAGTFCCFRPGQFCHCIRPSRATAQEVSSATASGRAVPQLRRPVLPLHQAEPCHSSGGPARDVSGPGTWTADGCICQLRGRKRPQQTGSEGVCRFACLGAEYRGGASFSSSEQWIPTLSQVFEEKAFRFNSNPPQEHMALSLPLSLSQLQHNAALNFI